MFDYYFLADEATQPLCGQLDGWNVYGIDSKSEAPKGVEIMTHGELSSLTND